MSDSQTTILPGKNGVAELAWLFLKLGTVAFGGPAAHIAMMEDEVVRRRNWLMRGEFLDLVGACNLIPGPNSTELAIHIGLRRAGWIGLLVAGGCFILPAFIIVMALAWAYVAYGKLPQVEAILYGIKPVIIAVIIQALWRLGQTALKTRGLIAMGLMALIATLMGINELVIIFSSGLIMAVFHFTRTLKGRLFPFPVLSVSPEVLIGATTIASSVATTAAPFTLGKLFLFFLKVGSVLFGSGYVLLAFLRADLVERWQWLTEIQLLDAIAVGQFTPGPVFTTATFIGYMLGGFSGGVIATIGIFLPAFVFVAITAPFIPRLRASPIMSAFLDGVNVASLALMAIVTYQLGRAALTDWFTVTLMVVAGSLLFTTRLNSAWLVLGGAFAGWIASTI
jgi:chromate transporter